MIDGELTVRAGRLSAVRMSQNPLQADSVFLPVDPSQWQRPGCSYEDLTVEAMFDLVERGLKDVGWFGAPLTVRFDEQTGFITEYRFGRSSRGGVFGYSVGECCTWFELDDLVASP
jgi:hypothetical protein